MWVAIHIQMTDIQSLHSLSSSAKCYKKIAINEEIEYFFKKFQSDYFQ